MGCSPRPSPERSAEEKRARGGDGLHPGPQRCQVVSQALPTLPHTPCFMDLGKRSCSMPKPSLVDSGLMRKHRFLLCAHARGGGGAHWRTVPPPPLPSARSPSQEHTMSSQAVTAPTWLSSDMAALISLLVKRGDLLLPQIKTMTRRVSGTP